MRLSVFAGIAATALFFTLLEPAAADNPPPDGRVDGWLTRPDAAFIAPAHRGAVTSVVHDGAGNVFSAGSDGFLVIWDGENSTARERFQLSPYTIEKIAVRPEKRELAVYESDSVSFYRVSVWDYAEKRRLFTIPLSGPALYCDYTALGGYLIICLSSGVLLINAESGEQYGGKLGEYPVSFAVSSRTERTLQMYSPLGALYYWDIENSSLAQQISVPQNLRMPLVFGNFRFLAGQDNAYLFVVDAVSGKTFYQTEAVRGSLLFRVDNDDASFFRVSFDNDGNLRREVFTVRDGGVRSVESLVDTGGLVSTAAAFGSPRFLIGLDDGRLAAVGDSGGITGGMYGRHPDGDVKFFSFKNQSRVFDAAALNNVIAFTGENGGGAFIPADFNELLESDTINFFNTNSADRISTDNDSVFLFWQRGGDMDSLEDSPGELRNSFTIAKTPVNENAPVEYLIDDSIMHGPLRGVDINEGKILFLDVSGYAIKFSVDANDEQQKMFLYASPLSLDAVFVDARSVLIARNADTGRNAAPFLLVDSVSGETLPLAYPAFMAFKLYKSPRNNVYGAVLKSVNRRVKTEIIRFDAEHPESSRAVHEYDGEYVNFSFIEYSLDNVEYLLSSAGGEGAYIIPLDGLQNGEAQKMIRRTPAFPHGLLSLDEGFAVIDGDGSIAWYDGASGEALAILRIYENEWLLSTSNGKTKRGAVNAATLASEF
ncbi:MAG: WD40 repeat domain-containing protein [Spirochaetaceae bacterium]|nr:WD40 repeat domain-containing protein [Spirochaetaceae bacterium]